MFVLVKSWIRTNINLNPLHRVLRLPTQKIFVFDVSSFFLCATFHALLVRNARLAFLHKSISCTAIRGKYKLDENKTENRQLWTWSNQADSENEKYLNQFWWLLMVLWNRKNTARNMKKFFSSPCDSMICGVLKFLI
jgi:hypothetical protein